MVNKFEAFMEEPKVSTGRKKENSTSRKEENSTSRKEEISTKRKVEKKRADKTLASVKLRKSSFEKLAVLHMALETKQLDLLDEAIDLLFEAKSAENSKVRAFEVLMNDLKL